MIDRRVRSALAPPLDVVGARLARWGVHPVVLTAAGWAVGVLACVAVAQRWWALGLVAWLVNRLADGLDGPVARSRGATDLGGYLDVVADFSVYGGFVLAVAVAEPPARVACVSLLVAYYVSGTALLALSSLLERRRHDDDGDPRSLRFAGGLAEGTETVAVYVLFCLLPADARWIAWGFTAAVAVTAVQRVAAGVRLLTPVAVACTGPVAAGPVAAGPVAAGSVAAGPVAAGPGRGRAAGEAAAQAGPETTRARRGGGVW